MSVIKAYFSEEDIFLLSKASLKLGCNQKFTYQVPDIFLQNTIGMPSLPGVLTTWKEPKID